MLLGSSSLSPYVRITGRCLCLGGCVPRGSALRILAMPAVANLPRTESASTDTLPSPSLPSAPHTHSGSDSAQVAAGTSRHRLLTSPEMMHRTSCRGRATNSEPCADSANPLLPRSHYAPPAASSSPPADP